MRSNLVASERSSDMIDIDFSYHNERPELTINGTRFICQPMEIVASPWAFPVGEGDYPSERWYCAVWHDPTGVRNGGYKHTGIDINLDVSPWGDVERQLELSIYAVADGVVHCVVQNWYGVPMIVVRYEHEDEWLYVRYGHITPVVSVGQVVRSGQRLGGFANWRKGDGGDHLHLDMSRTAYTTKWFTPGMLDPVPVLKAHLGVDAVDAMLSRGG